MHTVLLPGYLLNDALIPTEKTAISASACAASVIRKLRGILISIANGLAEQGNCSGGQGDGPLRGGCVGTSMPWKANSGRHSRDRPDPLRAWRERARRWRWWQEKKPALTAGLGYWA